MNKINDHDLFFEAIDKIYSSKNNLLFLSKSVLSKIEDNFLKKNNERIIFVKDIWYENEKLKNDYKYICDQCEFILKELRTFLNNHHNKNYSERFWKILIGPWIFTFISVIFERWHSIKNIIESYNLQNVYLRKINHHYIPLDIDEFKRIYTLQGWNHFIYDEIFSDLRDEKYFKIVYYNNDNEIKEHLNRYRKSNFKNFILKKILQNPISDFVKSKEYLFFSTAFDKERKKLIKQNLKNSVFSIPIPMFINKNFSQNDNLRNKIDLKLFKNDKFSKFLNKQIKNNLPMVFLELFTQHLKHINSFNYPKKPKGIFTASGLIFNSNMSRYVAETVENKSKLNHLQHGGCYEQYELHWPTQHEISISDKYFSWGWKKENNKKIIPIGINKNLNLTDYNINNKNIYFETRVRSNYTGRLDSASTKSRIDKYIDRCCNFLKIIKDKKIDENFFVRLHARSMGYDEEGIFKKFHPKLKFCSRYESVFELKKKSKIFIHTSLSTGHLESFAINFPCLIFADSVKEEMFKEKHSIYFNDFKNVKILFDKAEDLIEHLEKIDKNIYDWWKQKEIQSLINEYSSKYGYLNKNYERDLIKNA